METFFTKKVFIIKKVLYVCSMNSELKSIIKHVGKLYKRYGVKSITMDDVARELGISKKTLYQYINDKSDLVQKVIQAEFDATFDLIQNTMSKATNAIDELLEVSQIINQRIRNINPSFEYDLKKYYPKIFARFNETKRIKLYHSIKNNLERGKEAGFYRDELNTEIIAKLHVLRIESKLEDDFFSLPNFSKEQIFKEFFIYHIRGICNDKGIQYFEKRLKEENHKKTRDNE